MNHSKKINGYFFHQCGSTVLLDLTPYVSFLTTYGISHLGITPAMGEVDLLQKSNLIPIFYCPECKIRVNVNDLVTLCSECKKNNIPLNNIFKIVIAPREYLGGFFCEDCIENTLASLNLVKNLKVEPLSSFCSKLNFNQLDERR